MAPRPLTARDELCLEYVTGSRPAYAGKSWTLTHGAVVGRTEDVAIRFQTEDIARAHCRFAIVDEQWCVEDLGSRAGTELNGTRLAPNRSAPLHHDDSLRISDALLFRVRRSSDRPALHTVRLVDDWIVFSPFAPDLAYAIHIDDHDSVVRTIMFGPRRTELVGFPSLAAIARTDTFSVYPECAGPEIARCAAADPQAALDPSITLALLKTVLEAHSYEEQVPSGARLTWDGRIVVVGEPTRSIMDESGVAVAIVGAVCGHPQVGLDDHRRLLLKRTDTDLDVRNLLLTILDMALRSHGLWPVIKRELEQRGPPSRALVAGITAQLFPEQRARHERILEEARMRGALGLGELVGADEQA